MHETHVATVLAATAIVSLMAVEATAQDVSRTPEAPRFVDAWFGGPLDSIYNAEYPRLQAACSGRDDACYREALDTTAVRLAPVWASPEANDPAGWLVARLATQGRWPYAGLLFEGRDGRRVVLRDNLGDWGYGTTLVIRDARRGRVQPWLLEPAGPSWVGGSVESPGFGIVEGPYGLEERLWRLGPVEATVVSSPGGDPGDAPDDASTELPAGVYKVLGVRDGVVRLRAEIPQDMDCGQPVDPSVGPESVPVYEAPLERLLDASGRPQVEVAYPKGC